jgi:hypothetical protein
MSGERISIPSREPEQEVSIPVGLFSGKMIVVNHGVSPIGFN